MKIKTNAFVLKTTIFKESSLIIRLFTREKGKSTYIVKAAMRQKSPNKAIYQQLNEVEVDYSHHPKKQIHPVYSVKLIEDWENICTDLKKTVLCTSMLEIIDKSYDEEIPDTETYDTLKQVMIYFESNISNLNNAFYYFILHFLKNSGYNILSAKKHPIILRFQQKNSNILNDLNLIFDLNLNEMHKSENNPKYEKTIMIKFMSELVRYHFPDVKSFKVAKDLFS
jgi:DNA repair protein RecO (recombination protein O)